MDRSLIYNNNGRGGTVVYKDDQSELKFDFEFGGGSCVAIIFIPGEAVWSHSTKRKIGERDDIIEFVAKQALIDQVSNGYYKISDNFIELYKK